MINKHDNLDDPLYNRCNHGEIKDRTWLGKGKCITLKKTGPRMKSLGITITGPHCFIVFVLNIDKEFVILSSYIPQCMKKCAMP